MLEFVRDPEKAAGDIWSMVQRLVYKLPTVTIHVDTYIRTALHSSTNYCDTTRGEMQTHTVPSSLPSINSICVYVYTATIDHTLSTRFKCIQYSLRKY